MIEARCDNENQQEQMSCPFDSSLQSWFYRLGIQDYREMHPGYCSTEALFHTYLGLWVAPKISLNINTAKRAQGRGRQGKPNLEDEVPPIHPCPFLCFRLRSCCRPLDTSHAFHIRLFVHVTLVFTGAHLLRVERPSLAGFSAYVRKHPLQPFHPHLAITIILSPCECTCRVP